MSSGLIKLNEKEKELIETFLHALCVVHKKDSSLFEDDVNERDVCSHIMSEIEKIKNEKWFSNYSVDVDYNRMLGGGPKIIYDERIKKDIPIIPDLVIHGRGRINGHENLLCVEVKKSSASKSEKEDDLHRLRFLTRRSVKKIEKEKYVFGYYVGIYYEYNSNKESSILKIFKYGCEIKAFICTFTNLISVIDNL